LVGLLWTGDQPVADLYPTTHKTDNTPTSKPSVGFESTILPSERLQSHAIGRVANVVGLLAFSVQNTNTIQTMRTHYA